MDVLEGLEHEIEGTALAVERRPFHTRKSELESEDYTRFIFNPAVMLIDGVYAVERSWTKVSPGKKLTLATTPGSYAVVVNLLEDEATHNNRVLDEHADHFASLTETDALDWDFVGHQDVNYIDCAEQNVEHIVAGDGFIIAPPHSRRRAMDGSGWHFMFTRGSRSVGCASDYRWEVRSEEALHHHNIVTELYLGLAGEAELSDGRNAYTLGHDQIAIVRPGERHKIAQVYNTPTQFLVINNPSIPGDKVIHE